MVGSPCGIVEKVRNDLLKRSKFGLEKYGVTLEQAGLTRQQALQHAYEEALDLACYLTTEIERECENGNS